MPTSSFVSRAYKKTRLRHALLAITLTLASATFPALASTKLRLDIPAQDLGSALKGFQSIDDMKKVPGVNEPGKQHEDE